MAHEVMADLQFESTNSASGFTCGDVLKTETKIFNVQIHN